MVFKNNNVFSVWYQNKPRTVSSHVLLSKNNIFVAWYWVEPYKIDNSCFYQTSTFSVCGIKTKQLFLFQCKMVHIWIRKKTIFSALVKNKFVNIIMLLLSFVMCVPDTPHHFVWVSHASSLIFAVNVGGEAKKTLHAVYSADLVHVDTNTKLCKTQSAHPLVCVCLLFVLVQSSPLDPLLECQKRACCNGLMEGIDLKKKVSKMMLSSQSVIWNMNMKMKPSKPSILEERRNNCEQCRK